MEIDVKQAVVIATNYLTDLMKGAGDVTLEEVELSSDDRLWYITLSALIPEKVPESGLQTLSGGLAALLRDHRRVSKKLAVETDGGSVRFMKNL
jgi:hypothetical protein